MYRVDFSSSISRWVFEPLYKRVLDFALSAGDTEAQVKLCFAKLVAGEPNLHLLIETTSLPDITAHCLISVQGAQAFCEQLQVDGGKGEDFVKECIAYAEALPGITHITFLCDEKKYKAFQKKYGFTPHKVLMRKEV